MITYIVQIPASLLQDWVIPLLEIADLVWLDSAVVNHNLRTLFLEQIRGVCLTNESFPIDNRVAQWLIRRNIRVSAVHVSDTATDVKVVNQLVDCAVTLLCLDKCNKAKCKDVADLIQACTNVKSLSLTFCNRARIIVESIPLNCTTLQAINLSNHAAIDLKHLVALTSSCKQLTELIMNNCKWINDEFTATIAENCPQLQKLSVDYCHLCEDGTIQVLAEYCHHLHYLSFSGLYWLTDEGVTLLAGSCIELRTCLLLDNHNITTDGIIALAQGCTKLRRLAILSAMRI